MVVFLHATGQSFILWLFQFCPLSTTLSCEWNEPWLHCIKWYCVDQCSTDIKGIRLPPLGYCFASFSFLGSVLSQLDASISGDNGTVSLVQFIDHVVILFQLDIASFGNPA